ncbi:MAG: helix-turn-helix domain-containing protein [Bacteroidota bacterium]
MRNPSFSPMACYPNRSMAHLIHHYEWIEIHDNHQADPFFYFPSFRTGLLFLLYQDKPVLVGNKEVGSAELFSTSMLPPQTLVTQIDQVGSLRALLVIFQPGGLHQVFGKHMREFQNRVIDISSELDPTFSEVHERLMKVDSLSARVILLDTYLKERLAKSEKNNSPCLFRRLQKTLGRNYSSHTVQSLAESVGIGKRHLNRLINERFGVTAKTYLRIHRFRQTLASMKKFPNQRLCQIALNAGYWDQAHFSHEFKEMTGSSPKEYLANMEEEGERLPISVNSVPTLGILA